mmetsp:Transcript_31471/g.53678  ORF Transcript_31471/g.53678 Transcript_31471/m.53678 type:complete len:99 (+) Transcript_31471:35-331(+)
MLGLLLFSVVQIQVRAQMFPMPIITQPEIRSRPPTGVIGPKSFLGPTSRHNKYMLPENMAVPNAIILPPDQEEGDGGLFMLFGSIVERESRAMACSSW